MDDKNRVIKVMLKGVAYSFTPIGKGQKTALALADRETEGEIFTLTSRILRKSAGPEQWKAIMNRLADDELSDKDVTKLVKRLVEQGADDDVDDDVDDDE